MVFFIFIQILIEDLQANSGESDQTPCSTESDLSLHCLSLFYKKDAGFILVKIK